MHCGPYSPQKQAVAEQPTVVSIWADISAQDFAGGIWVGSSDCRTDSTNQAVLAAGYDTSSSAGLPHWLIKVGHLPAGVCSALRCAACQRTACCRSYAE